MNIIFKNPEELACDYAIANNKIVIYEYKEHYCENTEYDNFGFTNPDDFIQLCKIIFDYLVCKKYIRKNVYYMSEIIELGSFFQEKEFEFRLCSDGFLIKIVNYDSNSNLIFIDHDDIFFEIMSSLLDNYNNKSKK
jgi:hypothetical protein